MVVAAAVRGRDWREAATQYTACTELRPNHAKGHACLARVHEKLGEADRALAVLRRDGLAAAVGANGQVRSWCRLSSSRHNTFVDF